MGGAPATIGDKKRVCTSILSAELLTAKALATRCDSGGTVASQGTESAHTHSFCVHARHKVGVAGQDVAKILYLAPSLRDAAGICIEVAGLDRALRRR